MHLDSPAALQLSLLHVHATRVALRNIERTAERPPLAPGEAEALGAQVVQLIRADRVEQALRLG